MRPHTSYLYDINNLPEVVNSIVRFLQTIPNYFNKDSNSDIIQQDLDALCTWAQIWQLRFNVKKYKTVHNGKNNQFYQYTMNFEVIETQEKRRILGLPFNRT